MDRPALYAPCADQYLLRPARDHWVVFCRRFGPPGGGACLSGERQHIGGLLPHCRQGQCRGGGVVCHPGQRPGHAVIPVNWKPEWRQGYSHNVDHGTSVSRPGTAAAAVQMLTGQCNELAPRCSPAHKAAEREEERNNAYEWKQVAYSEG